MKKRNYGIRVFECQECGNKLYAPKKMSKMTKDGHLKNMYCPFCKVRSNKVQIGRLK